VSEKPIENVIRATKKESVYTPSFGVSEKPMVFDQVLL
jgi:hypothetical protein